MYWLAAKEFSKFIITTSTSISPTFNMEIAINPNTSNSTVTVTLVETSGNPSGQQLVNPAQASKCSDPTDLVELARQIQKADEFTRANAVNKLSIIVDQIKYLQDKARQVLDDARRDDYLHHAACNFKKVAGNAYFLYQRPSGQNYFSMLSPEEWGVQCPHKFLGVYRLEADMSWTPQEHMEKRSEELALLNKIFTAQKALTDTPILKVGSTEI